MPSGPTLTTSWLSQPNLRNGQRDVPFSSQDQVKTKKRGHHVFRRPIFLPKSSGQRHPGYVPENARILKDFHRTPETVPSNTRGSVEPRLRNTALIIPSKLNKLPPTIDLSLISLDSATNTSVDQTNSCCFHAIKRIILYTGLLYEYF